MASMKKQNMRDAAQKKRKAWKNCGRTIRHRMAVDDTQTKNSAVGRIKRPTVFFLHEARKRIREYNTEIMVYVAQRV